MAPSDWAITPASPPKTVIIQNGNGPWGGLSSGAGRYFVALQNNPCCTQIAQYIQGLVPGNLYTVRFLAAERPNDASGADRITVSVGGIPILSDVNPLPSFMPHQVTFNATANETWINFTNTAPNSAGDSTAYVSLQDVDCE